MFAALYSLSVTADALVRVAHDYSPRVEVAGALVLADLHGVANNRARRGRLFAARRR